MDIYFYCLLGLWIASFIGVIIVCIKRIKKLDIKNKQIDIRLELKRHSHNYKIENQKVIIRTCALGEEVPLYYTIQREDFRAASENLTTQLVVHVDISNRMIFDK
jgi:hypothetical protein